MVESIDLLQDLDTGSDDDFDKRVERVIEEYHQKRSASQVEAQVSTVSKLLDGQLVAADRLLTEHNTQVLRAVEDILVAKEATIKSLRAELENSRSRSKEAYTGTAGTGESPTSNRHDRTKTSSAPPRRTISNESSAVEAWSQPSAPPPKPVMAKDARGTRGISIAESGLLTSTASSPRIREATVTRRGTERGKRSAWHNWGANRSWNTTMMWSDGTGSGSTSNTGVRFRKAVSVDDDPASDDEDPISKRISVQTEKRMSQKRQSMSAEMKKSVCAAVYEATQQARSEGKNVRSLEGGVEAQGVFIDAQAMKERVKEAVMKPEYNVCNFYKKTGIWQLIARSVAFDYITLGVIAFNALWIAIDTDRNRKAATLLDAHIVFVVAENCFCTYFSGELFIRFMAFAQKWDVFKDYWFLFDSALVVMMIVETWILTLVLYVTGYQGGSGLGNASILRLVRLLRLTRMARMARLLRAMPELMILVKGIFVATRSVFFTLCLLVIIIYVFAIAFAQLAEDSVLKDLYFSTVPDSMNALLLRGTLPDLADTVETLGRVNIGFAVLFLLFVLLSVLTVMNMLVGVLVEVVSVVSAVEKEQMTVQFVKTKLISMLDTCGIDADGNHYISKDEFEALILMPKAARIIQEVGVDVVGLVDFADFIFQDGIELSFEEFLAVVLQLRGSNGSTVRDIVDLRKFFLNQLEEATMTMVNVFSDKIQHQFQAEGAIMEKNICRRVTVALENVQTNAWAPNTKNKNSKESASNNNSNNNVASNNVNSKNAQADVVQGITDSKKSVKFGLNEESVTPVEIHQSAPSSLRGGRSPSPSPSPPQRTGSAQNSNAATKEAFPRRRALMRSHSPAPERERSTGAFRPWSGNVKVTTPTSRPDSGLEGNNKQPLPAFPQMWVEDY